MLTSVLTSSSKIVLEGESGSGNPRVQDGVNRGDCESLAPYVGRR